MSFQQGLSGLSAASTNLDTIGNNIANASTIGFKQGVTQFSDMFANSLTGGLSNAVGLGVNVPTVAQEFSQGNIETTGSSLNTAINGNGFFVMSNNGTTTYSRDGEFSINKNGNIVNPSGAELTGYAANANGTIATGSPVPLQLNTAPLPPAATSAIVTDLNLNAADTVPATAAFSATDPTSYNNSTSVTIYDTLGSPHTLTSYFQLQPVATDPVTNAPAAYSTWNVYATVDGQQALLNGAGSATMLFDGSGKLIPSTNTTADAVSSPFPAGLSVANPLPNGATLSTTATFDLGGSTQFGAAFAVNSVTQNGYQAGQLTGFSISQTGLIQGSYSNGTSQSLGQIALANFTDPNGLMNAGNNAWSQTAASGQPLVGTPGSGTLGVLQGSALEQSNVDLTSQLVNMITAQRVYQANAQTVKTEDQILQTITSLQ